MLKAPARMLGCKDEQLRGVEKGKGDQKRMIAKCPSGRLTPVPGWKEIWVRGLLPPVPSHCDLEDLNLLAVPHLEEML